MRDTVGSSVSATDRLSMLKPRPLNSPATRASTPNSFSTRMEMTWSMGSIGAVAGEDLHDPVLAGELELLQPLLLHLLFGRQVVLLLEGAEPPLEIDVLLVVAPELRLSLEQGLDERLVLFFHASPPCSASSTDLNMLQNGLSTRTRQLGVRRTDVDRLERPHVGRFARREPRGAEPRDHAAARMVRGEGQQAGVHAQHRAVDLARVAHDRARPWQARRAPPRPPRSTSPCRARGRAWTPSPRPAGGCRCTTRTRSA